MAFYKNNEWVIPTLEEIAQMSPALLKDERMRLKNEVSFKRGDAAIAGPSHEKHEKEIAELNKLIKAIADRDRPRPSAQ